MKPSSLRGRAAVAGFAAVALLGGCTTEPDAIDEQLLIDMALVAADATLEDVALWSQPFGFGQPAAAPAPARPGGSGGFTFSGSRSVTFYDEGGVEQEGYDPLTTASIHIVHEVLGEASRDGWSATVYRERDKTVSGLLGEETTRTWNGTGGEEITRSRHLDDGTQRSYEASGTVEYEEVVVPIPGSDPRWPLSGTIRRTMTVTRSGPDGETTRTVEIVITFDGTSIASLVVNGELREIDLAARDGASPLRHRR